MNVAKFLVKKQTQIEFLLSRADAVETVSESCDLYTTE